MIDDQRQIEFFRSIAQNQYAITVCTDYGINQNKLVSFTDGISNIYKNLQYNHFKTVIIYTALDEQYFLSNLGVAFTVYNSYENLTPLSGDNIVIELKANGTLNVILEYSIDLEEIRKNSIIYRFNKALESEYIYGKSNITELTPIPDADSYFAIQSYKTLELALEDYKTKIAFQSECEFLKRAWFDENKIFFKNRPEFLLRDSLTQFLKIRLRNTEVRPEQIVDKSHPVDIKVTWALANRLALIEIKWLGRSLKHRNKQFTSQYYPKRALNGAFQLANYLDENLRQSPTYATKGYLVIFDGRRAGANVTTTLTLDQANALKYINEEIQYNPEYHTTRKDFSIPYRFFMQPQFN